MLSNAIIDISNTSNINEKDKIKENNFEIEINKLSSN